MANTAIPTLRTSVRHLLPVQWSSSHHVQCDVTCQSVVFIKGAVFQLLHNFKLSILQESSLFSEEVLSESLMLFCEFAYLLPWKACV